MGNATYAAGRFALGLDGAFAGFIKGLDGGYVKGEVATHNMGTDNWQAKHLATISYEPVTVEVGMGMSKGFYEWIRASFDKGYVAKNFDITACDFDYKAMARRDFTNALITEVTIPALDGSSKDPAYMTIKMQPETIVYSKGDGSQVAGNLGTKTKKWLCSNFRIEIGDMPCSKVAKIDSFTWKQGVAKDEVGQFRSPTIHPTKVEVPNLKLTISMADVEQWANWHKSFVIDGKCSDADELSGSITFLGPDLKEELATIDLLHIGLISLQQEKQEANKDGVARFTVELYVEQMKFNPTVTDL